MLDYIADKFTDVLGLIQNHVNTKRELKDNALNVICDALNGTKVYYANMERGLPRDIDKENELSRLWARAAVPLRHFDEELAMICENKASYWLNPDNWRDEDIHTHGIALSSVTYEYQKMLAPKAKRVRIEPQVGI
ncbi:hypothetical protein J7H87_004359 [Vibrio parahaemolyticus]|nr:hypothetical protein [Vibrio parahaemolyticus]EHK0063507.1 hypothetical protein [Vibrio parahaemolyticus]EHR6179910.1 hypothetical protein [Vibrio parahaemolyticus]ELB2259695.1 hypothetical protein [Vibrio parahaemolyticus]HCG5919251.1 hypothetical protein [Vibrio parahaemolyticus]